MPESFELLREVQIDAPPALVFEFFTDPELLMRWHCVHAECDLHVGGAIALNVTGIDTTRGEFLVIEPPHRLVFTWGFAQAGNTEVEVTFAEHAGGTLLRLTHRGFAQEEFRDRHHTGWVHYLARLQIAAAGRDPGVDPWREK